VEPPPKSNLPAIGLAVAGALIVLGAFLISTDVSGTDEEAIGPLPFWLAFLLGGILMIGLAVLWSADRTWARPAALLITSLVVLCFALLVNRGIPDAGTLLAYGFVASGMVVGIAVLVSDSG
jgi:hypothetical protein